MFAGSQVGFSQVSEGAGGVIEVLAEGFLTSLAKLSCRVRICREPRRIPARWSLLADAPARVDLRREAWARSCLVAALGVNSGPEEPVSLWFSPKLGGLGG